MDRGSAEFAQAELKRIQNQTQDEWIAEYEARESDIRKITIKNCPPTIKYPEKFASSSALGFDGVSDWRWYLKCFSPTNITPMDIDGFTERKGNFLVLETKALGKQVPPGQMTALEALHKLGCFTVIFIEGKTFPEKAKIWAAPKFKNLIMKDHKPVDDVEKLQVFIREWFIYANDNKFTPEGAAA